MNDLFSKTMLGVIALCLLALVAQTYAAGSRASAKSTADSEGSGARYRLVPVPMTRTLLRIDQETGETWQSPLMGAMGWKAVSESNAGMGGRPSPVGPLETPAGTEPDADPAG